MGIDVANLFRLHSAISQCQPHTGRAACTARCRGGKMVSIAVSAIAHNLGVNLSATLFSGLQFFQQQHTAALAHHKTAAPGIKGDRGPGRVVCGAEGFHAGEAAHPQRADAAFAAAAEHTVLVSIADTVERIPNRIGTACAGSDGAAAHTLQAKADGHLPRRPIADGHGDKVGADLFKAPLLAAGVFFLDRGQTTDPAGQDHAEPCVVDIFQCNAAVVDGFVSGGHGKLGKPRHFAGFAPVNTFGRVKIFDFCGQFHLKIRCIKSRDRPNGAAASFHGGLSATVLPVGFTVPRPVITTRRFFSIFIAAPHIPIPPSTQRTCPVM